MKKINTMKEFIYFTKEIGSSVPIEFCIDHMPPADRISVCVAIREWLKHENNFFECYEYRDRTWVAVEGKITMAPLQVPAIYNTIRGLGYTG